MKLSLVFPVYKKRDVVSKQVLRLYRYIQDMGISFEFILVIDGLIDDTKTILETLIKEEKLKNVRIFSYRDNRGKGYAVRYGMKKAKGEIVGFTDADTDILPKSIGIAFNAINGRNVDIVAPSKLDPRSNAKLSLIRKLFSFGLRTVNRILLRQPRNVKDIAGGLKLFTKNAAKLVFSNMTVDRFAMDSELFYWVDKYNLKVAVTPIFLNHRSISTSTNLRQIMIMLGDIVSLAFSIRTKEIVGLGSLALKLFRS